MEKTFAICLATASFVVGSHVWAQESDNTASDEAAIRRAIESYAAAFNRGDAAAVASHWSQDGEFATPSGQTFKGRAAIQQTMASYFTENKGVRVEILDPTIEFLSPSVAVENGTARIVAVGREPSETDYTAVHVKHDGRWTMDSVREAERLEPRSHYEQLRALEWLIGRWVDQDEDATVETVCEWTKNKNFITRSFKVAIVDGGEIEGTQIIGWDPQRKTIRSWVFDSEGGFGVGIWSNNSNQWTVRVLQVLHDGATASAINTLTYVDENTFKFKSSGREIRGQLQPNIPEVTIVRK